jgi:hypothetical protein
MNVTLSIDDRLVTEARKVAETRGMSLNQMIREELQRITAAASGDDLVRELEAQWTCSTGRSGGWRWNREELYDRPLLR